MPAIQSQDVRLPVRPGSRTQRIPVVLVYHPDGGGPLFFMPAGDTEVENNKLGVHAGTIMTACGILADNNWNGKLVDRGNNEVISCELDDIIPPGEYTFYLNEKPTNYSYPIVRSFQDWSFPCIDKLPDYWHPFCRPIQHLIPPFSADKHVEIRDEGYCRLTLDEETVEHCHVVETKYKDWYLRERNTLWSHNIFISLDGHENKLLLASNVHKLFDSYSFCFVPKRMKLNEKTEHRFVAHTVRVGQAFDQYHNVPMRQVDNQAGRLYLARFAETLFHMQSFLDWKQNNLVTSLVVRESNKGKPKTTKGLTMADRIGPPSEPSEKTHSQTDTFGGQKRPHQIVDGSETSIEGERSQRNNKYGKWLLRKKVLEEEGEWPSRKEVLEEATHIIAVYNGLHTYKQDPAVWAEQVAIASSGQERSHQAYQDPETSSVDEESQNGNEDPSN